MKLKLTDTRLFYYLDKSGHGGNEFLKLYRLLAIIGIIYWTI